MKIKLAILEKDTNYLNRIVSVFTTKYSDNFEVYSFTDLEVAMANLDSAKIEVLLASDEFNVDAEQLPKRCVMAYLVESSDVETFNNQRAIAKFQKVDLIYKQVLSIYSEQASNLSRMVFGDDSTKIVAFQSVSGGCGASTMAAACALRFASKGKKTLYLSLETCGSAEFFFHGEGQFSMSDVVFALKSRKTNLALKLESCVKQDPRGVYFYSPAKVALDMLELKQEDILRMITELKITGSYDVIILDLPFSLQKNDLAILEKAQRIAWVGDGSMIANAKFTSAYNALKLLGANSDAPLYSRICCVYNKFGSKTSTTLGDLDVKTIGGAPRYEQATSDMIVAQLSQMGMLDELIQ